ncbi:hypothetical protein [Craterilacuibacter sinensis]|uniref:Uncharacterized protein n=1 Tax=Craterilacuibacter sinensis TaxID=2686017 RepID=A0A845BP61_9NEIS|nr:hypothetical protein [Craterilacuibacter sinensis]MXR38232.1 hypothetical protein [Craterilacuibacter sinensis]
MHKNEIAFAGEAIGLPEISQNALQLAERDGLMAALRLLHVMRWHLEGHEHQAHGHEAATTFAESFFSVFDTLPVDPLAITKGRSIAVLIASLVEHCPAMIDDLERGMA